MANLLGPTTGYAKRAVPTKADELPAWLTLELGNIQRRIQGASHRTITTATTVLASDGLLLCNAVAPVTVTWPTPLGLTEDWWVTIKRISGGATTVTIAGTVDGVVNPTLAAQYSSITIWSSGTALHKIASV